MAFSLFDMREFKFRAWYKDWDGVFRMSYSDRYKDDKVPTSAHELMSCFFGNLTPEAAQLMQYTGLKDRNGKEIYEGDICKKYWSEEVYGKRDPEVGVIKWVHFGGRYTLEINGLYGHKYYHELHENLTNAEYPRSLFEVIGNIYQNAKLLKS